MALHRYSRTELVIGPEGLEKLKGSTVVVLGMGGVGSYTVESLARCGVGRLVLVDKDDVDITNINRQIPALTHTVGMDKVELMAERVKQINPEIDVVPLKIFYLPETKDSIFAYNPDYVVDAIDTISAKILAVVECHKRGIPVVSSMGAANKIDPTMFRVMDISKTSIDPIAKIMRRKLKDYGIYKGVKVVCSLENPRKPREDITEQIVPQAVKEGEAPRKAKNPPASIAFVPSVAGLILSSVVVRDLVGI
ncbi:tRNA threonylcarbamoyladenosine dehydratase [Tumebacillus permanentifrigoris]|uniref:tRNA A37 threonylcarbamoyladenosine dehydratase n=1 Tax=Tumebacillus permanentifrigoris TaxID=378543 RepID=A0A316D658_9BACL|nr:tRNA threonylcarbamoyladenosine dehydratase [Tumebacillus permanentifrigoris]PWK10216.1 tRNA A37 threonylcarbamoyladenosine dehydratase [Tumebacillus permanentifrigoris]